MLSEMIIGENLVVFLIVILTKAVNQQLVK